MQNAMPQAHTAVFSEFVIFFLWSFVSLYIPFLFRFLKLTFALVRPLAVLASSAASAAA